jgi:hypothetical protein
MIFDFRQKKNVTQEITINKNGVKIVDEYIYKYIGCIIVNKLNWSNHIASQVRKVNQRMYFLRCMKRLNINGKIIAMFYNTVIQSILTYAIVCWFPACDAKHKTELNKITKRGCCLAGEDYYKIRDLQSVCNETVYKKTKFIIREPLHPLHSAYKHLHSGRRLCVPLARTMRYKRTFVPYSIRLYNNQK